MIIRKAKKSDFEEWFKLEKQFMVFQNKFLNKEMKYKLVKPEIKKYFMKLIYRKNNLFLVLEDKSKLYGYFEGVIEGGESKAYVSKVKKIGYANNCFISKSQRGKSYFSKFIKEFYKYLKEHKIKYCVLHVNKNNPAVDAYRKWGFKVSEYKMLARVK